MFKFFTLFPSSAVFHNWSSEYEDNKSLTRHSKTIAKHIADRLVIGSVGGVRIGVGSGDCGCCGCDGGGGCSGIAGDGIRGCSGVVLVVLVLVSTRN